MGMFLVSLPSVSQCALLQLPVVGVDPLQGQARYQGKPFQIKFALGHNDCFNLRKGCWRSLLTASDPGRTQAPGADSRTLTLALAAASCSEC
jgi:hypothetical protein